METLGITNSDIIRFLLVFFRIGAVLFTAPIFGSKNIPSRVRIVLACTIAIVLTMSAIADRAEAATIALNASLFAGNRLLVMAVFQEVFLGIAIGYTARLTFTVVQMAGQLVGMGMGFSMARIIDPSTRENVMLVAQYKHNRHHADILAYSWSSLRADGHWRELFSYTFGWMEAISIPYGTLKQCICRRLHYRT
jgi:flagellar biosynthetic protein FliR